MPHIALLIETGATPSSVTATLDLFSIASRFALDDAFQLDLFSSQGGVLPLSDTLSITTQPLPSTLDDYAAVFLPGFFAEDASGLIEYVESKWQPTIALLRTVQEQTLVAASCYGTFVLAESGLLDGRAATTTWWLESAFAQRYPEVRLNASKVLVDDDNLLTAGAMTAHTDLSLHVLRRLKGHALARRVGSVMLVDEAKSSQQPFMALPRQFPDPQINTAVALMEKNLSTPYSVEVLADALNTSYRTLHRRFHSVTGMAPTVYQQSLRIEQAKELLETTQRGIEQVACAVGYQDVSSFRRTFSRLTGTSPAQYRKQFRRA